MIESPDPEERAHYRRIIHAAKQHHLVPAGLHLRHTGRAAGDLVIRLSSDENPDDTDWNRIRLNTRRVTTDPDLVFAALEKDQPVSRSPRHPSREPWTWCGPWPPKLAAEVTGLG